MDVSEYYRRLLEHRGNLLQTCVDDESTFALHVISHNTLKDFDTLLSVITGPESIVFSQACREFQYSLEAILYGNYRHAFSSLRLALELFTASTFFSTNQLKLNLWMLGSSDIVWNAINDEQKGVYSHDFMKAFNPDLGSYRTQYMTLSAQVYRECSEYVHGNPDTHEDTALTIAYDVSKIVSFHDKVSTVRLCVLFQFFARYLLSLNSADKTKLEPLAIDAFGNLPEIQASFGAAS